MGKKFKKLLAMALTFAILATFCVVPFTASAEQAPLKFDEEGNFKIVIFSDVQDQYPVYPRVLQMMRKAIARENPDLIVFTGDMTEMNTKDPEVDYRRTVEQILGPVVEAGIPYAITFGNHDNQNNVSGTVTDRDAMLRVWQSIGDCRTTDPAPELTGAGTCKIPIYASNSDELAFNLWMVDSNSYQNPLDTSSGYDNPHADQLAWMVANNDADVNSIVFQHIPMPETYNLFVEDENGTKEYGGKKYNLELKEGVVGTAGEFPATIYAEDNTGEFQTFKEMGNVLGVVSGHDHLNDFTGYYDGIQITAVPGMTYFNYGDEAVRGYGVIELNEDDLSNYEYHSVKYSELDDADDSAETVYDAYDEITYADLKENGNALGETYTINGGHTFTYDATSPSYSAVLKFRWTAGTKPGFQFSFDEGDSGNIANPFGVWIKRADQTGPNGAWHLKPNVANLEVNMTKAAAKGDTYDIEFGRLKVLSGNAKHIGEYYVYLKVDGKLVQEGYSHTDENGIYTSGNADCQISNKIRFGGWGNGGDDVISKYVEPAEQYAAYDVIGYEDLLDTGNNPLTPGGIQLTKTNNSVSYVESAEAAKTHSVIFKLRWTMETMDSFQIHLGSWGGKNNFAYVLLNNGHWQDKATNAAVALKSKPIAGDYYDLEVGRLMVTSGKNAGKYYSYFKVDGEILFEKYVAADDENTTMYLKNTIFLGFEDNHTCKISATPYDANPDSLYYDYDEVTYYDFLKDGSPLSGDVFQIGGNSTFTYDRTSETGSAIIKFRWKEANAGSSFQLSFDREGETTYMFGVQLYTPGAEGRTNSSIRLRPGLSDSVAWVELAESIEAGKDYDIEFARLKVKNGEHKGDWHVYFKLNGELIAEDYVDGSLITKQGNYTTNPGSYAATISNMFYLTFWGNGGGNKIAPSPYEEKFDNADEIGFEDLFIGDISMDDRVMADGNHTYTYNATSPSYSTKFNFRWTAGATEPGFTLYFDDWKLPFCFCAKYPGRGDFGAAAGENGAWHLVPSNGDNIVQMTKPAAEGDTYDIEVGRLKVLNGKNKGKYYVYAKVDGELIKDYYYDGVVDGVYDGVALSNEIIIASTAGNAFSEIPADEPDVPVDPEPESPYYAYDEITFNDLYLDGVSMAGEYRDDGNHTYTYNATSDTYSVIFKYRWTAGATEPGFTLYLDDWKFPFCFCAKYPGRGDFGAAAGENGAWHLVPSNNDNIVQMTKPANAGDTYDIEIGRLKVKTGENAGKYYVYAKVGGELIKDYYYDGVVDGVYDGVALSNKIIIASTAGNKFSATPVPEVYEAYDEIGFNDLYVGDISMNGQTMTSKQDYHYNATSPSYSVILKYRWIAGGDAMKFTTFFDDWVYPFCFAAKTPNQTGFGAAAGPNGAWHLVPSNDSFIVQMDKPVAKGDIFDIEIARLKVASGANAGKYYVYAKVNGELIQSYYYDGVVDGVYAGVALSNKIIIDTPADNKITAIPFVEEYEDFDEIGFEDLKDENGNSLGTNKQMSGATTLKYDVTSATGSVIFKYNWTIGSVAKFQMSFEKTAADAMAYMFGAWLAAPGEEADYPNGRMWLRPSYGPQAHLEDILVPGTSHNVEFARLKVKNGPNAGKYLVYIKIDDVLIAQEYVAADIVDANGNYVTGPGNVTCNVKSGEIFFAYWGSEGNVISAYKDKQAIIVPEGSTGDFDGNNEINATDLVTLKKILLGTEDTKDISKDLADYNKDSKVNILDLIAMKKDLSPNNNYSKTGSLTLGMQEHLGEDESKTAQYIADATAAMGATSYRLSKPIHTLYYVTAKNEVAVNEANMAAFKEMVAELKAKGIDEILYVTDSFILPANYSNSGLCHNITVPNPSSDPENYIAWLTVNAAAFKALAEEVPEIKFFEPFNEINTKGTRFEKYGVAWESTSQEQANFKYTVEEKAAIMADLCWYISRAVKSVDPENQVTSPSIVVGSNVVIENDFIEAFYAAIESGAHPINNAVADKRVDNYFTIVNIHAYPDYTEDDAWIGNNFESNAAKEITEWAGYINTAYNTVKAHGDGDSRVWITETGMSTSDGEERIESNVARIIELALQKLDSELTFIDTVIFYQIADMSTEKGASPSETYFGLFYSYDDLDHDPYAAKLSAKAIYSYFHNGTTDYSALDALVAKYAG